MGGRASTASYLSSQFLTHAEALRPQNGQMAPSTSSIRRAVSSIRQCFTMFGQIAYEAITNNGKTVEDVAVEALGKDRNALSGKVAITTGANSGLGLQNARVLMCVRS